MDASQEQTDIESFEPLEPVADGFRNYQMDEHAGSSEHHLIDKAQLLTLTAPEISDGQEKLVRDFVAAWSKVMELDRFDL